MVRPIGSTSTLLTSTSRTARCGPACRVVWQGRGQMAASYADWKSLRGPAQSNQNALPLHSVPRLGSACPHSGIAPGARRHRPSMAGGGYRGILAAVPPAQRLRSASGKGATDQDQKQKQQQDQKLREQASSHIGSAYGFCSSPLIRPSVSSPAAFDFEVYAPSRGRVEVLRSGHRGKDAAVAAPGHGWPMAAGPRSRTGARACRA